MGALARAAAMVVTLATIAAWIVAAIQVSHGGRAAVRAQIATVKGS